LPVRGRTFSGEVSVPDCGEAKSPEPCTRIQILEDAGGAIALGPVTDGVVYACLVDDVSPRLATSAARRLGPLLDVPGPVALFVDAHDPERLDIGARNALVRCLFARRKKLRLIVSLVRTSAVAATAGFIAHVLGTTECVTDDGTEFDRMLTALAPLAYERIAPSNWVRAAPSERPRIRLTEGG
jgi:hypothetical protein